MAEHTIYALVEIDYADFSERCNVLVVALDDRSRFMVLNDFECEWPIFARDLRQVSTDIGYWIREHLGLKR